MKFAMPRMFSPDSPVAKDDEDKVSVDGFTVGDIEMDQMALARTRSARDPKESQELQRLIDTVPGYAFIDCARRTQIRRP